MEKLVLLISIFVTDLSASGITLSKISPVQSCPYSHLSYTDDVNLPLLLQEKLAQHLQSLQIQAKNYQPYLQQYTAQTKNAPSPVTNDLNDFYVNKILSNPIFQDILNSKAQTNQRVSMGNPVKTTNKPVDAPQVINNYIIVPSDALNKGNSKTGRSRKPIQETQECCKRKAASQNRPKTESNRRQCSNKTINEADTADLVDENQNTQPCKRQRKNDVNDSKDDSKATERRRKRKRLQNTKRLSSLGNENTKIDENIQSSNITDGKPRNLLDDRFIEEFCNTHPGLPKLVVEKMLSHLKQQMVKYRPELEGDNEHPLSFDGKDEKDNKNTSKRHTNRKANNGGNLNKYVTSNSANTMKTTQDFITNADDEIQLYSLEESRLKLAPDFDDTDSLEVVMFDDESLLADKNAGNSQRGYPWYSDNKHEYVLRDKSNDKGIVGRVYRKHNNLRNKNVGSNTLYKIRPKHVENTDGNNYSRSKQDPERNAYKFRRPPALELPNFQTKPILKGRKAPNRFNDKFSTYSDIKQQQGKELDYYKRPERTDDKTPNIETHGHSRVVKYGKTDERPVETFIEMTTPTVTYYISDNMEFEDDGHSLIVTKKIPSDKFWRSL